MSYKLGPGGLIIRLADGAFIPPTTENGDYAAYQAWVAAGNTPTAADPAPLTYSVDQPLTGRATSPNANPRNLFTATLAQNTGYVAQMTVIAVDMGNGNMKSWVAGVSCKRLTGGAVMVGTPTLIVSPPQGDAGTEAWTAVAGVSGNDFVITVTGVAGRTIAWAVSGTFTSFTPSGR